MHRRRLVRGYGAGERSGSPVDRLPGIGFVVTLRFEGEKVLLPGRWAAEHAERGIEELALDTPQAQDASPTASASILSGSPCATR